jgi:hypothetical protein
VHDSLLTGLGCYLLLVIGGPSGDRMSALNGIVAASGSEQCFPSVHGRSYESRLPRSLIYVEYNRETPRYLLLFAHDTPANHTKREDREQQDHRRGLRSSFSVTRPYCSLESSDNNVVLDWMLLVNYE